MSSSESVLSRALELQAEARKRGDTAKDRDDALRVATNVENAEKQLVDLEKSIELVAALRAQNVEVEVGDLDSGLKNFEKHAGAGGLPSQQAVQSATKKIGEVKNRVRAAVDMAWRDWAGTTIHEMPTDRLALIGQGRAGHVNRAVEAMRSLRIRVPTDPAEIAEFVRNRDLVLRELNSVVDPGPHLREVLKQLQDGTTLDQLTDDDITTLRQRGWAPTILVKRADVD